MRSCRFIFVVVVLLARVGCAGSTNGDQGSSGGGTGSADTAGSGGGGDGGATSGGATGGATGGGGSGDGATSLDTSGGDGTSGGDHTPTPGCDPILNQADQPTGFEMCPDGSKHHFDDIECPEEKMSPTSPCTNSTCSADSDCTDEPHGYCAEAHLLSGYCGCYYGCRSDADCDPGSICECGVVVGTCVPATCTTNADCGAGLGCASAQDANPDGSCVVNNPTSYTCQTAADECSGPQDCPNNGNDEGACRLSGDHRVCGLVCGLPPGGG